MNHRFAWVMLAGLALTADRGAVVSASGGYPNDNVEILVGGVPQRRFAHDGRWYVEALKGREYAIRLHNPYGVRVAVALAVDGLNTIDARETTAGDARKWVLDPYETITISGWQTSSNEARRFEFTTEERSYGQALGKTANLGVISAAFFRERPPVILSESMRSRDRERYRAPEAPQASQPEPSAAPAPAEEAAGIAGNRSKAKDEYAATGMGRRTDHAVTQVWLDLEGTPAQTTNIRYEFRPQLVRLGILPERGVIEPLDRRERARGFEPGFSPVPPQLR